MATRYTGKVKSFSLETGYGFVECPKVSQEYGMDVYLHHKSLEWTGIDPSTVHANATISFEVWVNQKGQPQASNIKVLFAGDGGGDRAPALSSPKAAVGLKGSCGKKGGCGSKGAGSPWPESKGTSWQGGKGAAWSDSKGTPWSEGKGKSWSEGKGSMWSEGKGTSWGESRGTWQGPPAFASKSNGKGGKATVPRRSTVEAKKVDEAAKNALGETASATVVDGFGEDGSPLVQLSLNTFNALLKAAGHNIVEGCAEIPDDSEGFPGYEGSKVEGPWYAGTIKEYIAEQAYGLVESAAFKELYGEKPCFIHADHLDPDGTGSLIAKEGEEVMFPVVEDEEGNAWAWTPVIPKARDFIGVIKTWSGNYGFVHCELLWQVFEEDVYLHGAAAEYGGLVPQVGVPVVFNLHLSKKNTPQASSPRPPGLDVSALPGSRGGGGGHKPAKRPRLTDEPPKPLTEEELQEWHGGTVKAINAEKGFGFIECDSLMQKYGRDVFIHSSVLETCGAEVGTEVFFQIVLNSQGQPQAAACSLATDAEEEA